MQIDLNKTEIQLIDQALETWEKEAHSSAIVGSMFGAMMTGPKDRETLKSQVETDLVEATKESQKRRVKSLLLRAKIYQALARESEHELAEHPVEPVDLGKA